MILRALVIWFALLVVAVCNGWLREVALIPRVGSQVGHVVSTLLLCVGILVVSHFAVPWIRPNTTGEAVTIGVGWLLLTLVFEFGFGRLQGRSWEDLFADYNVFGGRVWVLVLITTALAPLLVARVRGIVSVGHVP